MSLTGMGILEWMETPADLYQMALEIGHVWEEGKREALADMDRAAEMKQASEPRPKRKR